MTNFNLAPDTFTKEAFEQSIHTAVEMARGMGFYLGNLPTENSWDQSTFFDHDAGYHILSIALELAKAHAKANNLFYNQVKLEDACTLALTVAYGDAFIAACAPVA